MALLVWSAMFPFSTIASYGLAQLPFITHWPLVARTFCLTCMLVPYMVFIALPFLTQRFKRWLQLQAEQETGQPVNKPTERTVKPVRELVAHVVANRVGI